MRDDLPNDLGWWSSGTPSSLSTSTLSTLQWCGPSLVGVEEHVKLDKTVGSTRYSLHLNRRRLAFSQNGKGAPEVVGRKWSFCSESCTNMCQDHGLAESKDASCCLEQKVDDALMNEKVLYECRWITMQTTLDFLDSCWKREALCRIGYVEVVC